jgi:hypothetical protein
VISAFIATAFAQDDAEAARQRWRHIADQIRPKAHKLAGLMDEAETDVLAYMSFPPAHRAACPPWQTDASRPCRSSTPSRARSYTTSWDTIHLGEQHSRFTRFLLAEQPSDAKLLRYIWPATGSGWRFDSSR